MRCSFVFVLLVSSLFITGAALTNTAFCQAEPGTITTVVADQPCSSFSRSCVGGVGGDGGPAISAKLYGPSGLFVDASGNMFIADNFSHRIRLVDGATGIITTVAGNSHCFRGKCDGAFSGDGRPATAAELNGPRAVVADSDGNLFISDTGNNRIRRVDKATGIITTVAGTVRGAGGYGGPAKSAELNEPWGIALDASGNLFIADSGNYSVLRVDRVSGIITKIAGLGYGYASSNGDGGPATSAVLTQPNGLFVDNSGDLLITSGNSVRRVDHTTGIITTVAGGKERGFGGDGGPAVKAQLWDCTAVVADNAGNLFIADSGNHRIRRVDHATGFITTIAGNGVQGYMGDGGPATSAQFSLDWGLAVDAAGNLFIADSNNNRIRRVRPAPIKPAPGNLGRDQSKPDVATKK